MEVVMVDYHWRPFQDVRFYFFHDKQDEKCGSFKEWVVYLTLIETQFYLLGLLTYPFTHLGPPAAVVARSWCRGWWTAPRMGQLW
jgi:hypothetical protein